MATKKKKIKVLNEGDLAPDFTLSSDEGKDIKLSDFKGRSVVLYFYPKDDTPGCTQEACDFRDSMTQFNRLKGVILGVSKDSVESHQKFRKKFSLQFPLLADPKGTVCETYGVWKEKSMYGRKYMGIERSTFVIGPDQKIKKIFSAVKVPGHVQEVLETLV